MRLRSLYQEEPLEEVMATHSSILGASLMAQMVMQETQVQSLGQEDLLEKEWLPTPVFLPGEFHGQRSLVGYIQSMGSQSWT